MTKKTGHELHKEIIDRLDAWARENGRCMACTPLNVSAFLLVDATLRRCTKDEIDMAETLDEIGHNFAENINFVIETAQDIINDVINEAPAKQVTVH